MSKKLDEKRARREGRERRLKEQRKQTFRRNLATSTIALLVAVGVAIIVVADRRRQTAALAFGPSADEAGCEPIEKFKELKGDHIPATEVAGPETYNSMPPTSGPMWEELVPGGFSASPMALPAPLHNLEHGQIIVYYTDLDPDEEEALVGYADDDAAAVIAAPAPEGVTGRITLTGWTALQSCDDLSTAAIDQFRRRFQGGAPEGAAFGRFES